LASAATAPPAVRLVALKPITVAGSHFKRYERVTVSVSGLRPQRKTVRATRIGTFTAVLERAIVPRCGSAAIRAVGALGSYARVKIPLPGCIAE
jgi:hypothetical protein